MNQNSQEKTIEFFLLKYLKILRRIKIIRGEQMNVILLFTFTAPVILIIFLCFSLNFIVFFNIENQNLTSKCFLRVGLLHLIEKIIFFPLF